MEVYMPINPLKNMGTPVKGYTEAVPDLPGFDWELSEETMRAIQEIYENIARAQVSASQILVGQLPPAHVCVPAFMLYALYCRE